MMTITNAVIHGDGISTIQAARKIAAVSSDLCSNLEKRVYFAAAYLAVAVLS
ncbi:hypothetical protein FM102_14610 [Corynebacterium glutamicum]|nr:hypothetical protein FM102_14610 [Corynebacterium glutamicum]